MSDNMPGSKFPDDFAKGKHIFRYLEFRILIGDCLAR